MRTFAEMEDAFYEAVRAELLDGLKQCTPEHHRRFKQMYAGGMLVKPMHQVVAHMPRSQLKHAMRQVKNTVDR